MRETETGLASQGCDTRTGFMNWTSRPRHWDDMVESCHCYVKIPLKLLFLFTFLWLLAHGDSRDSAIGQRADGLPQAASHFIYCCYYPEYGGGEAEMGQSRAYTPSHFLASIFAI